MVETALQITLDAGPVLGETVVVFGLGVVGLLTVAMLQRAGARVIAVEPQRWRRDVAATLSATAVAPDEVDDALDSVGCSDGVSLVIEASGNPAVLSGALGLLAHEGTALVASWYGTRGRDPAPRRRLPPPPADDPQHAGVDHPGPALGAVGPVRGASGRWSPCSTHLPLDVLATHTFDFGDAASAYAAIDGAEVGLIQAALGYS